MPTTLSALDSVITLQKYIRGVLTRKKYVIKQLTDDQLEDYPVLLVGNDPIIEEGKLAVYKETNEKIALIATSGMRAVLLACQLGNTYQTPKIILLDNSWQVQRFWHLLQDFMADEALAGSEALFNSNFFEFFKANRRLYSEHSKYRTAAFSVQNLHFPSADILGFFENLINAYGYNYTRKVIAHTSIIKQSWGDKETFVKIKNLLNFLEIKTVFSYPSNIIATTRDKTLQQTMFENIALIAPSLSIHTDLCLQKHMAPERVHLISEQEAETTQQTVLPCSGYGYFSSQCLFAPTATSSTSAQTSTQTSSVSAIMLSR